jgi:periplasmic protein TonB
MSAVTDAASDGYASDGQSFDLPSESARWIICFLVAAAVHGGVALFLMTHFPETVDESGVDGPVVMLDLPESLVPSIAPPQDLSPGPMEEEIKATPPKEETKQPEPEAEVALPKPELPRPEPPAEEKQAAAPQAARTPPPSVIRWQSQLAAHIERFKRYPKEARARGESGTTTVAFTINHEGHLLRSSIVQSSGSAEMDRETLAMVSRAQPMPRPPDQMTGDQLTFVIPVRFNLR